MDLSLIFSEFGHFQALGPYGFGYVCFCLYQIRCDYPGITPELWDEIEAVIQQDACDGYYLNRRVFFLGTWIRHGGKYPDWNLRLFRHAKGRYENLQTLKIPNTGDNEVHEHVMIEGRVGYLKHDILHEDFRDLYHWLARHNRYSNWEAQVYYNLLTGMGNGGTIGASLLGDAVQRKRFLKKIWVRLPASHCCGLCCFTWCSWAF